jgi:peroxiredoxin Q/BCP
VTYFAASCDTPETNKEFGESLSLDFPLLSDPGKSTAKAYGVVTPERELPFRWTFYIDENGKILHIDKEVNTSTAGADVAKRLTALGVAKSE